MERKQRLHPRVRSFLAGLVGAAVMALVLWQDGHFGIELGRLRMQRWDIAIGVHFLAGALFGLAYGYLFDALHRAGWRSGMLVGTLHGVLVLVLMSLAPSQHALYQLGDPTWAGALFTVALHALFGAVVGVLYEPRAPVEDRETTRAELGPETRFPAS